jgi:hypothetical protein
VVLYEIAEDAEGKSYPLRPLESREKFSFMLLSKDPFLINYSELPLDIRRDQIYHLHNLNGNMRNGTPLLTSRDSNDGFVSQRDLIELRSQCFGYSFKSPNSSAEIEIVDELGDEVLKVTNPIVEGVLDYRVDLRGRRPGKFTLRIDGMTKLEFYAADELIGRSVFGIIDLFQNQHIPESHRLSLDTLVSYAVEIGGRSTYWEYHVILKYDPNISAEHLSVKYPVDKYSFGEPVVDNLPDGTSVAKIISSEPIPLREEPVKGIQLIRPNGDDEIPEITEITDLPKPSVKSIYRTEGDREKICSKTFVYL